MDLLLMFFGFIAVIVILSVVLAQLHGGDGSDLLDFHPGKRLEQRYSAEFDDMEGLLESHNARRRAKGLPDQTEDEYREEQQREDRRRRQRDGF